LSSTAQECIQLVTVTQSELLTRHHKLTTSAVTDKYTGKENRLIRLIEWNKMLTLILCWRNRLHKVSS